MPLEDMVIHAKRFLVNQSLISGIKSKAEELIGRKPEKASGAGIHAIVLVN